MKGWRSHAVGQISIFLLFTRLLLGVQQLSFTADEPAYIAGGYALLARGKEAFSLLSQRGYTPLICGMEALLFYVANPTIPLEQLAGWPTQYDSFAQAFEPYMTPLSRTALVARAPVIWLTVILGVVVFRWGRDLWGPRAGLLALVVLAFDPTLLAHGRLATTDAAVVALGTAALYAVWRLTDRSCWHWAVGAGILLGLTMLAKVSGVLWTVAAGLMVLASVIQRRRQIRDARLLAWSIAALMLSLLTFWAGYGFTWGAVRSLPFAVPAPAHWESSLYLTEYASEVFALGQRKYGSWWWYYPLSFLIKNPLPLLIAWITGLVVLVRRPSSGSRLLSLSILPVLYAATALLEGMNIGYRHMLPIHPFLYLTIGGGLGRWTYDRQGSFRQRWMLGGLGAWYLLTSLHVFPYEIAYFNELVGGPEGGYRYLVDSNLDWGQSARSGEDYLRTHPEAGTEPPASRFRPSPGQYIVSASHLQGIGIEDPYAYEWFRHWEPETILDYSILVYDVPPYEMTWIAQCSTPRAPLDEASMARETGQNDLRRAEFDCTRTWLYPGGGATPGLYALNYDLMKKRRLCLPSFLPCPSTSSDPFVARHLSKARLSYEQPLEGQRPAFALYEMPPDSITSPHLSTIYAVPAGVPPADVGALEPLSTPLSLDGPLVFLNAVAYRQKEALEAETWWRVTDSVIDRPFSMMGHLVSAEGEILAMADGFGASPLALVTGDVVVQRHRFPKPPQGARVFLLTGVYWLDAMELWPVTDMPGVSVLLIHL